MARNRRRGDQGILDMFSQSLVVSTEKVPGHGEDFLVNRMGDQAVVSAVFDGCGGSGGRAYAEYAGYTGAYVASRAAASAVDAWCAQRLQGDGMRLGAVADEVKACIQDALAQANAQVRTRSRLKSTLQKDFPTTVALCVVRRDPADGDAVANVLWAGDSRCYLLDAEGLHQLTVDDVQASDPLANIHEDGVMTNVVSATADFELHEIELGHLRQGVVFAASDGCFGYLPSPMHFEYLLLDTLMSSSSLDEWESHLRANFGQIAGDDATLVGTLLGFDDFASVQRCFQLRHQELLDRYIGPYQGDPDQLRALWETYRDAYAWYSAYEETGR